MKTIASLAICGGALLLSSTIQLATAAERFHVNNPHHVHHTLQQQLWNANASMAVPAVTAVPMSGYVTNGGMSAPAGR